MRTLLAISLSLSAFGATPAFVTGATAAPGSVSSFTITDSPSNGNAEFVTISMVDTTKSVTSVADNGTSTYYFRGAINNSTNVRLELWSTTHNGVAGSPTTITVHLSGATDVTAVTASYSGATQLGGFARRTANVTAGGTQGACSANTSLILNAIASAGTATYTGANLRESSVDASIGAANGDIAGSAIQCTSKPTITLSGTSQIAAISMELMNRSDTIDGSCVVGGTIKQCVSAFYGSGAGTILGYTFEVPNTAGNLLLTGCQLNNNTATWAVGDTASNTWANAIGPISNGAAGARAQLQYAANAAGASNLVNVTTSTGVNTYCTFAEYVNVLTSSPLDQTGSGTGNSTAANSGNVTTLNSPELLIGLITNNGASVFTAGSGWTTRTSDAEIGLEDQVVAAATAYAATMTVTSGQWVAIIATFDATGLIHHRVISN